MGDFNAQFHGLPGNTVGEKRHSLQRLLNAHPNQTIDLIPQNHLERLFYVDALIFYRDFEKLYANYLKNDDITVNKLRNCPWFFRRVLDEPVDFVREILPKFSYVARQKLITGASKVMTEDEADGIFDALVDRYGLAHGLRIVTRCSKPKVSEILEENENVVLKTRQLKVFHKTFPEVFEKFMPSGYSEIFLEIANHNPDWFIKLVENKKCERRLGRRSTKSFVKKKKDEVLEKAEFYLSDVLDRKQFVRMMGENFEKIYEQLLPDKEDMLYFVCESWQCLKYYPENKRYLLYMKAAEKKFGKFDTSLVTDNFLKLVKDFDLRENLAVSKYKETQCEDWWQFYKTSNCVVKVSEMLNSSSNQRKRNTLAKILAINCYNNKDYEGFLQVLELLSKRMKNDAEFLKLFFYHLTSPYTSMNLYKCNESHWKLLTEIASAPDFESYNKSSFMKIHVKYMVFLSGTEQSEACDNLIQAFIDKYGLDEMMDQFKIHASGYAGSIFERKFLISLMDKMDWKLFKRIIDYNKRNPEDPIDIFHISNLEEVLQETVPDEGTNSRSEIFELFFHDSVFRARSQHLYWAELSELGSVESIMWYLTHDLDTFSCNFDTFLHACFKKNAWFNRKSLWRKVKCYQHLVEKLLQYLSQHKSPGIFKVLAHFVNFEDYVAAFKNLEHFYASSITSANEKFKEREIRQKTYKAFRQFVRNAKTLNAKPQDLLVFNNRPFVKRLPMVWHAFCNIPEGEALPFLKEIRTGGVSVTKQALFMTCMICEQKAVIEELRRNKLTQTVVQALRYFIRNPSDELFEIVLLRLKKLDQNNKDTTTLVTDINSLPKSYHPKYFETLWNVLTDTKSTSLKCRTISKCQPATLQLQQVALVFETDFLKHFVYDFTSNFLIRNPAAPTEKLELFFQELKQFKQEKWDSLHSAKKDLRDFIKNFARTYLHSDISDEALIVQFLDRFKATFQETDVFEELIIIQLMQLKHHDIEDDAELLSNLIDHAVDRFSEVCLGLLIETTLEVLFWYFRQFENTPVELCYHMMQFKKSANVAILALKLLPQRQTPSKDEEELEMYQWLMATIKTFEDAKVKVHLSWYHKNL